MNAFRLLRYNVDNNAIIMDILSSLSDISSLILSIFRILYGTLSTLMVKLSGPMVTSQLVIMARLSILMVIITNNLNILNSMMTTLTILIQRSILMTETAPTLQLTMVIDMQFLPSLDRD